MPLQESNHQSPMKPIEEVYKKLTHLEHILLRPDSYVGSLHKQEAELWLLPRSLPQDEKPRFELRTISYVPALYKIFDEIVVNAADNKVRDPSQTTISISIDRETNTITVENDGKGIPSTIHKGEGIPIPQLIFGELLTGSNYDDTEGKITGGRNGYGAKLTNIYSVEFTVETQCDGVVYKQTWRNNMQDKGTPKISPALRRKDYTRITFRPDLAKFGMDTLDDDIVDLFCKRAYDLAGISGCRVRLNGTVLPIHTFKDYVALYPVAGLGRNSYHVVPSPVAGEPPRWEVVVGSSEGSGFHQVSFVNSIWTMKGGQHVNYIVDQIIEAVRTHMQKGKHKHTDVKPYMVKSTLFVFVNARIVTPSFDSQCKESLNTTRSKFGSVCQLPQPFLNAVRSAVHGHVVHAASSKAAKALNKGVTQKSRVVGLPKLDDANEAGTANAHKCTLILTEGESAKSLAVSGLSVVGRDRFGVYPLRGKFLNVRDATPSQVAKNEEVQAIMKALGLRIGDHAYKNLRYGRVMIMADQDVDGSHIKGLLLNFFHFYWPELAQRPGFISQFITPVLRATRIGGASSSRGNEPRVISFYSEPEFHQWLDSLSPEERTRWKIKYYKGLGTSTAEEAQEYFSELEKHEKLFEFTGQVCNEKLKLVFEPKRTEERKQWMESYEDGTYIDHRLPKVRVGPDFVDKELILFSRADCVRSIPSLVDGLKPSQRKILWSCFKLKSVQRNEMKIVQLSGYVMGTSAYHHGEAALQDAIVALAQDFVGASNVNYLLPKGQFGTRLHGGKDRAAARYIFTQLNPITRRIFPTVDDAILSYRTDDGKSVEPYWYLPVIPTVLLNGAKGIGTGWSCSVPAHNPRDLIDAVRAILDNGGTLPDSLVLRPWYRGYTLNETITRHGNSWVTLGRVERLSPTVVSITELPIGMWVQSFKDELERLVAQGLIVQYRENHTESTVHFEVAAHHSVWDAMEATGPDGILRCLGLRTTIPEVLVMYDTNGRLRRYQDAKEVLQHWYPIRLQAYRDRKQYLLNELMREVERLANTARFVQMVVDGELILRGRRNVDIVRDLERLEFKRFPRTRTNGRRGRPDASKPLVAGDDDIADTGSSDSEDGDQDEAHVIAGYEYLLHMPMISVSAERVRRILRQKEAKEEELMRLVNTTPEDLWRADLAALATALEEDEVQRKRALQTREQKRLAVLRRGQARRGGDVSLAQMRLAIPELTAEARQALAKLVDSGGPGLWGGGVRRNGKQTPTEAGADDQGTEARKPRQGSRPQAGQGRGGNTRRRGRGQAPDSGANEGADPQVEAPAAVDKVPSRGRRPPRPKRRRDESDSSTSSIEYDDTTSSETMSSLFSSTDGADSLSDSDSDASGSSSGVTDTDTPVPPVRRRAVANRGARGPMTLLSLFGKADRGTQEGKETPSGDRSDPPSVLDLDDDW